jgi:AbrB family looped-hinge helix DNA binding protein
MVLPGGECGNPAPDWRIQSIDGEPAGAYALHIVDRWGIGMTTVTVSSKYQVVIPNDVRKSMGIRPGQKLQVVVYQGRAEFIPVRDIQDMRGFLAGIDTEVPREADRA